MFRGSARGRNAPSHFSYILNLPGTYPSNGLPPKCFLTMAEAFSFPTMGLLRTWARLFFCGVRFTPDLQSETEKGLMGSPKFGKMQRGPCAPTEHWSAPPQTKPPETLPPPTHGGQKQKGTNLKHKNIFCFWCYWPHRRHQWWCQIISQRSPNFPPNILFDISQLFSWRLLDVHLDPPSWPSSWPSPILFHHTALRDFMWHHMTHMTPYNTRSHDITWHHMPSKDIIWYQITSSIIISYHMMSYMIHASQVEAPQPGPSPVRRGPGPAQATLGGAPPKPE